MVNSCVFVQYILWIFDKEQEDGNPDMALEHLSSNRSIDNNYFCYQEQVSEFRPPFL